jgi:pentatricopeptide repeat protein
MNRIRRWPCALILFYFSFFTPLLFAGGQEEEETIIYTMDDADRLIEQRNYNEAIEVLIALSHQDPEYFEMAQDKIRYIRKIRDSYNDTYNQLIKVLFEEEDYEQALSLIRELDSLDSNPNEATKVAIRDARISAELVYYRKIFNEIMDKALVLLGEGESYQALKLYETGFELFRQTFDESEYGTLIKDPIYRAYDELVFLLDKVEGDWDSYSLSEEENLDLILEDSDSFDDFIDDIIDLGNIRNRIYQISMIYEKQNLLVMEGNKGVEDFHLSFMNRLLSGRQNREEWEGITVALDYYLESSLDSIVAMEMGRQHSEWDEAYTNYSLGNWSEGGDGFYLAELKTVKLTRLYSTVMDRIYLTEEGELSRLSKRIARKYYDDYRKTVVTNSQYANYRDLIEGQSNMDRYELSLSQGNRELFENLRSIVLNQWESFLPLTEDIENSLAIWNLDPLLSSREDSPLETSLEDTQSFILRGQVLEENIVLAMADWDIQDPEALLVDYESRLEQDAEYISGVEEGEDFFYRYPQRSLDDLALLNDQLASLIRDASAYRELYRGEQSAVYDGTQLTPYIGRVEAILERAVSFNNEIALMQEDGENFIYLAQKDFNAGEFRFSQAETQLNNSNFQLAREELSLAQELYVSALSYDEDSFSRVDLDARIADLQARIVDEENKKVIRDVRELINQGKSLYFQGLYAQSESRLIQAENKWFTTNTEENSELAYWMSLVRTALSVESGRYLEESNPLYNEISQLLNLAWKNYQEGQSLLGQNRKVESLTSFTRAEDFLRQVLILMPLNQNASVLNLRILKARDEDNFSLTFSEKYRNALSKKDFQKEQAYIELKDLAEIIPDYSNIQSNILALEYDLGIKIPPPDPAVLRKSTELYNSAKAVFDSGNLNLFTGAIEQLSEAISLNPNNSAASELIDQMRLYEGGVSTVVLSSASLGQYQSAEEKFVAGDYVAAYQIIQELWKVKANQAYPPLQELKRRTEANLGL